MAKHRKLKSGINNIAHHSVSGLSYLHPAMGNNAKKLGLKIVKINLLSEKPGSDFTSVEGQLKVLTGLRVFANEILGHIGYSLNDLQILTLEFAFLYNDHPDWPSHCKGVIATSDHRHEIIVDGLGQKIRLPWVLSRAKAIFQTA